MDGLDRSGPGHLLAPTHDTPGTNLRPVHLLVVKLRTPDHMVFQQNDYFLT